MVGELAAIREAIGAGAHHRTSAHARTRPVGAYRWRRLEGFGARAVLPALNRKAAQSTYGGKIVQARPHEFRCIMAKVAETEGDGGSSGASSLESHVAADHEQKSVTTGRRGSWEHDSRRLHPRTLLNQPSALT